MQFIINKADCPALTSFSSKQTLFQVCFLKSDFEPENIEVNRQKNPGLDDGSQKKRRFSEGDSNSTMRKFYALTSFSSMQTLFQECMFRSGCRRKALRFPPKILVLDGGFQKEEDTGRTTH
jgi:hypothetical protein